MSMCRPFHLLVLLTCFIANSATFLLLSGGSLNAQIPAPVIYSEADINLAGPGFYETWSCAFQGTEIWTDSIYTSYSWSNGATTNRIQVNTPQFTSDTLTLTVTDGQGNTASSTVVLEAVLTQNQTVLYAGATGACSGDSIDIFTWVDYNSYYFIWNWGDTIYFKSQCDIGINQQCVIFVKNTGNYYYDRYEYATGCWYRSQSVFTTFINTPPMPAISQSNDTLYASGAGPAYQWYDGSLNPISGATNNWYVPTASGDYYVEAIDPSLGLDCSSGLAGPFNITVVGLVNELTNTVSVFPNPTHSKVEVMTDEEILSLEVYDQVGRKVEVWDNDLKQVDLSNHPQGMYWLRIQTESGLGTFGVLRQ